MINISQHSILIEHNTRYVTTIKTQSATNHVCVACMMTFIVLLLVEYVHKKAFSGLTELLSLDLSSNVLTKINSNLFKDLVALKDLYLSNNPILSIESGAMDGLWSLDTLSLGKKIG